MDAFEEEIRHVINKHSAENASGTPDFILAKYLLNSLKNYNETIKMRAQWYGMPVLPTRTFGGA